MQNGVLLLVDIHQYYASTRHVHHNTKPNTLTPMGAGDRDPILYFCSGGGRRHYPPPPPPPPPAIQKLQYTVTIMTSSSDINPFILSESTAHIQPAREGWGGGGAVCLLSADLSSEGGEGGCCCPLSADSTSGVGVLSVCFRLIQPAREGGGGGGGGAVCLLLADLTSEGGEGGGCCCLLSADSTNGVGGAVCLLLADSTSEGGGGGGCCLSAFG